MIVYSLIFLSGCSVGIFFYWLFDKKIKITISSKATENKPTRLSTIKYSDKNNILSKSGKFYKAICLIEEVKTTGKLPFKVSRAVLHSLTIISQTPNWVEQLDDESLQNLNRIYDKWQNYLKSAKIDTVHSIGETVNMDQPKYWEGTEEEYFNALEQGIINENTKVNIIIDEKNYHGSWITRNADGSMEEYME